MMKRTFIVTGITLAAAILFVSFHSSEFTFNSTQNTVITRKIDPVVNMLPDELAGVYRGIKPAYVINTSESANLSPDAKSGKGLKELNFIVIETGIIWLAESDRKDSTAQHYEGSYLVTGNTDNIIEIKASFWAWNKQGLIYFIRFDRNTGKAAARAEGEPEFILEYIQ